MERDTRSEREADYVFANWDNAALYARADKTVYEYFLSRGYTMIDDIDAYDGVYGLMRHKKNSEDKFIKAAYHEGLVDSESEQPMP